jgi:hypothetical protein
MHPLVARASLSFWLTCYMIFLKGEMERMHSHHFPLSMKLFELSKVMVKKKELGLQQNKPRRTIPPMKFFFSHKSYQKKANAVNIC